MSIVIYTIIQLNEQRGVYDMKFHQASKRQDAYSYPVVLTTMYHCVVHGCHNVE